MIADPARKARAGLLLAVIMAVGLAAAARQAAAQGDSMAALLLFERCKVCHAIDGGKPDQGPPLRGLFGRKAGVVESFAYSPAMSAAGLTWNETSLDAYLTKPKALVPGTSMAFSGIRRAADRADLIAHLKRVLAPR